MTQAISSREGFNGQRDRPSDSVSNRVQSDEFSQARQKGAHRVQQVGLGLQVVHATAERIRIRAVDGSSKEQLAPIIEILQQQEGIKQVTWNEETRNLVIAFDKQVLLQSQLLAILQEYGVRPQSSVKHQDQVDPFATWKSAEFWKEQGIDLIPLLMGLSVTSRLGVTGLASIPIYMLTADVVRRTINSFRQALEAETEDSKDKSTSKSKQASRNQNNQISAPQSSTKETSSKETSKGQLVTHNQRTSQPLVSKVQKSPTIERNYGNVVSADELSFDAKVDYSIVHSIPGRIRFNIPHIAKDQSYARRLEKLLSRESHVTSVRLNSEAASVAISYQPASWDVSNLVGLIQLGDQTVSSEVQIKQVETVEKPVEKLNTVALEPCTVEAVTKPTQLNQAISQATPKAANNGISSIVADLKPPFINLLIEVVANFPLN
ncbi:MAG: hypothetical protein IGS39_13230 [Calothrix sp. C42_A2020_038]|nr:hypothetical protein [Calothrix sp. C42_A2020_038]